MIIQTNYSNIDKSDALEQMARDVVTDKLGHLADRLTRVEIHLYDDSSPTKQTPGDKRCLMEARPKGMKPLVVEAKGDDFFKVVSETAGKLARRFQKTIDRLADH